MKIDYVVMGHISRKEYFPYLKKQLGSRTQFSVDNGSLGLWANCRRAWSMINPAADYGFVVQDDAILADNFKTKVKQFVTQHPGFAYSLFFGDRLSSRKIYEHHEHDDHIRFKFLMWGLAVGLPQAHIKPMVKFGDNYPEQTPDDRRIKEYLTVARLDTVYPLPCLVDHRDDVSIVDPSKPVRKAVRFT